MAGFFYRIVKPTFSGRGETRAGLSVRQNREMASGREKWIDEDVLRRGGHVAHAVVEGAR